MSLRVLTVSLAAIALVLALWLAWRVIGLLRVATGLTSHTLCSAAFISGLAPDLVYRQTVAPLAGMGWVRWALRYRLDSERREVRASLLGRFESRAVFRPGLGCLVVWGGDPPEAEPPILPPPAPPRTPRGQTAHPRLEAALDRAFAGAGPTHGPITAVVVMQEQDLIAERYAPGYEIGRAHV
jgi:hypothetical protein